MGHLPDSEMEDFLASREVKMYGPPGTAIIFDGAKLLHRGGMVVEGERIALQVIFVPKKTRTQRAISFGKRIGRRFL